MNWSDWFYYDESSPSFLRWKVQKGRKNKNDTAGYLRDDGYWVTHINGKNKLVHRIIYELFYGDIGDCQVDHIDGKPENNHRLNLRKVTARANQQNMKPDKRNTSGCKGVSKTSVKGRNKVFNYWSAHWKDLNSNQKVKHFSIENLGDEVAYQMASDYRLKMIEELNKQGQDYTERHRK